MNSNKFTPSEDCSESTMCHVNNQEGSQSICEPELIEKYELNKCLKWIRDNNYTKTCLQFPEALLNESISVSLYLQSVLERSVYILGDTSYGSCCVDEVAAEHVNADSLIHFGHACLSPTNKLPVLHIFEKEELNLKKMFEAFKIFQDDEHVIIFFDDVYHHLYDELCSLFEGRSNIYISRLQTNHTNVNIKTNERVRCGRIFSSDSNLETSAVFIGDECITFQNLVLGLPNFKWYLYTKDELSEFQMKRNKFLMQRSYLAEKVKEANVLGILIGTLGIKNYLDAVDRIKKLVKSKGKKCYTLAIGKLNECKLANFPEIDAFVYIACQENSLLKDFKDYYRPVVSVLEVEMALGERPYSIEYTLDFRELLPGGSFYKESCNKECEASFCSNSNNLNTTSTPQDLTERHTGTIIESAGAQFLMNRTWRGLEQKLEEKEVGKAVKGRSGIPQAYNNELKTLFKENHES